MTQQTATPLPARWSRNALAPGLALLVVLLALLSLTLGPAPISVAAARRACHRGQRIPMLLNQPVVPLRPPGPATLL